MYLSQSNSPSIPIRMLLLFMEIYKLKTKKFLVIQHKSCQSK